MNIPLSNPDLTLREKQLVMQVLDGPNLSLGPKLVEFEEKISSYLGSKYAIAVNSGTSGLHLCIKSLNLKEGNEIITSPFSFIASANCILYERCTPIFVDINPETLNIDTNKIEEKISPNSKAILPVHVFGLPCDMDKILNIAHSHKLFIIEDACEAIGAELQINYFKKNNKKNSEKKIHKKVGTFGNCGVFAFYPNKQITTAEGGLIVTDDENIAKICRSLRNQGRSENGKWLLHERLGYNYRLSDIHCALGIAQIERINEILKKREVVASWYRQRFQNIEQIRIPSEFRDKKISWFAYVIRLNDNFSREDRDNIIKKLLNKGISCNNYFLPIHLQPFYMKMFGYKKGDFPITEHISERTIALPFFSNLQEKQVDYVYENLVKILTHYY